jgi:hypothetical protein
MRSGAPKTKRPVPLASLDTGARTDNYMPTGKIGRADLSAGWYSWGEILTLAALELWRCGEAESARVTLKARRKTVRQFLRERFGIVTGAREYWHRENWTPDKADLHEFLGALRNTRAVVKRVA